MGNLFDDMRNGAFDRVTHTMGYTATWNPTQGGAPQSATVLFKDDTEAYQLEGSNYDPAQARMEYRAGQFAGLKASVDSRVKEVVTIAFDTGNIDYWVQRVDTIFDGRNYVAYLLERGGDGAEFNADYNNDFNVAP